MGVALLASLTEVLLLSIPPRTCLTPELLQRVPSVTNVRLARDRRVLVTFAGSYWGTGRLNRRRVQCTRAGWSPGETERRLHPDGPILKAIFGDTGDYDYLGLLNDTIFCPQAGGVAGKVFSCFVSHLPVSLLSSARLDVAYSRIDILWVHTSNHRSTLTIPFLRHDRLGEDLSSG
jgi:hypothetical protein